MKKTLALMLLLAGLTLEARAETLTWNGSEGSMEWNTTDTNWLLGSTAAKYADGNDVVFGDTGGGAVTLAGELAPASVLVDAVDNYTFTGDGKLTGSMQLTKEGSCSLTINTANSYTGGTLIKGGTLVLGNDNALGTGAVTLGSDISSPDTEVTLDLNTHSLANKVSIEGYAFIGNGTLNGEISVREGNKLYVDADLSGSGSIILGYNSKLHLAGHTVSNSVTVESLAHVGLGTLDGTLAVADSAQLYVTADLSGSGTIILGNNTTMVQIGGCNALTTTLGGSSATINAANGSCAFNGTIIVPDRAVLNVSGNMGGSGTIILGQDATLDIGKHTLSINVSMTGNNASIGNGTLAAKLTLADNVTFIWNDAGLLLTGNVSLGTGATLGLAGKTLSASVTVTGNNVAIGNGTIGGIVTVNEGMSAHFSGETYISSNKKDVEPETYHGRIEAGGTTIQALHRPIPDSQKSVPVYPGLLQELSVSEGLIAGTGRASSLADGLDITSESDLLIKSMTITANNKIAVGEHTITLQDVTIKLSQTTYKIVEGVYLFDLSDLFHCSVDMAEVTFDASDLTLPEGFNPETDSISFNLGDAKLTAESAGRDITLLMGGYGSRTMSIGTQGNPVFTALVPIPEPTTGTLSLLGLAALAARRRK